MNCERCHGTGYVKHTFEGADLVAYLLPCPECGGLRQTSCCEGMREQPEDDE